MIGDLLEERFLWEYLPTVQKPIVLYGMGDGADKTIRACEERGIPPAGVFASDGFVRGQSFHGFRVTTYAEAKRRLGDMIVLLAFGTHREEVLQNALRIAGEQELYAPDLEVVTGEPFERAFLERNEEALERAFEMLADEPSRQTFQKVLRYKISGRIGYLFDCESAEEEAFRTILPLSGEETYVDAGAYDGDTIRAFLKRVTGWKRIVALEPDAKNFKKLEAALEGMERTDCLNAALDAHDGTVLFAARAGRQSGIAGEGAPVPSRRIDTLAPDASYIKLDVEGNELAALAGAEKTMRVKKPKLLVSAYHRHRDLFALPLFVKERRADYRVYLRHFRCLPAWDTNYYFV